MYDSLTKNAVLHVATRKKQFSSYNNLMGYTYTDHFKWRPPIGLYNTRTGMGQDYFDLNSGLGLRRDRIGLVLTLDWDWDGTGFLFCEVGTRLK